MAWNLLDFRFSNPLDCHIYLRTVVAKDYITVQVFGNTATKKDITIRNWVSETIEPECIYEVDPELGMDEEIIMEPGYKGYKAHAERVIKGSDGSVLVEALPDSRYLPADRVVRIAPKQHNKDIQPLSKPTQVTETNVLTEF
ncbi:hypothetical protein N752_18205 [Desulforamulus aquiferis]|nr:hypothetical protein N752_18205 [Desulforamulus aquiferis]